MSVLHVAQIARRIREVFSAGIHKDDLNPRDPEIDTKTQTRGLAAFAVHALTECTINEACAAVTDGGDDNGIDAIFYSEAQNCLVLAQSKWIKDGNSEPDSAEVCKFCNGVRDLVNSEFDRFNERVKKRQPIIENALSNYNCRLILVLVHTGKNQLAQHATRQLTDLIDELNDGAAEIASFECFGQERVHALMADGVSGGSIDLEFGLAAWGKIETPHKAFYGMITGVEIAAWWRTHGERLFTKNLRSILGPTDVNKQIASTIDTRPEDFWYFNNGITIIAKHLEKTLAGGGSRDIGTFKASGSHIVNGAQTVSTIGKYEGAPGNLVKLRVPMRVISLESADASYGTLITKANNTQNRIEARDFVAQDPEQQRIRVELQFEGLQYHIARSEGFTKSETAFDIEEATTALACATGDPMLAVLAKREIGRFWIDLDKAPYKRLFNPSTPALYVYHTVVIQRMVDQRMSEIMRSLEKRSGKQHSILVHGNRLISCVVFHEKRFSPALGTPNLKVYDYLAAVNETVDAVVELLTAEIGAKHADNFLAVVFKNPTKSKALFDACVGVSTPVQMNLGLNYSR